MSATSQLNQGLRIFFSEFVRVSLLRPSQALFFARTVLWLRPHLTHPLRGLWDRYDPRTLEIEYFLRRPGEAWPVNKEIFYDNLGRAKPNKTHEVLAAWEARGAGPDGRGGLLKCFMTQNIDSVQ